MMNFRHHPERQSLIPEGHLQFWKYLNKAMSSKIIIAGGFASAQLQNNMFGNHVDYNDIDFWYDDHTYDSVDDKQLLKAVGKCYN